jgi:hypothetical protein
VAGRIRLNEKSNNLIRIRTPDLPACSIVPQPTTLPRALIYYYYYYYSLLLHKLSAFGLSGGYLNWFRSYLSNRKSQVRVSGILSSPFEVLSGVPQGSVL